MITSSGISLFEILDVVGTIATVVALIYAIRSFQKNTRIQEAMYIKSLFESFQRDRQAILDNPIALNILATERNVEEREVVKESIGSFSINRAYLLFHLHQKKLLSNSRWEQDKIDIRTLFRESLVYSKWQRIRDYYPADFQLFIEAEVIKDS